MGDNEEKMIAMGLNPTMLKTLAITADGKCAIHPEVPLLQFMEPNTNNKAGTAAALSCPPPLQECKICSKEQQEKKSQLSNSELTTTTSASASASEIPPPTILQAVPSGTTLPSGSSKSSEAAKQYAAWSDTVMLRWNQLQDIGHVPSGGEARDESRRKPASGGGAGGNAMEDTSESMHTTGTGVSLFLNAETGQFTLNSAHNQSQSHIFNMSMAAVAEEPSERRRRTARSTALSQIPSSHATLASSSADDATTDTPPPWRRIEEQVKRQEDSIKKLQDTVERQETSIRRDLHHLIQLVTNLASSGGIQQQRSGHQRDIAVGVLETPLIATSSHNNTQGGTESLPGQQPSPRSSTAATAGGGAGTPNKQRPSLYSKSDHHPANMFTSVRTIERKPPKPPMRHGSFSSKSRRQSMESSHLSSIISSLGNSYNDTTATNNTPGSHDDTITPPRTIDNNNKNSNNKKKHHHQEEEEDEEEDDYGASVEFMLERASSRPLEIIFDASGRINSDFLHSQHDDGETNNLIAADNGGQDAGDGEEKKTGSSSGSQDGGGGAAASSRRASPPRVRRTTSSDSGVSGVSRRDSFAKVSGAIRLDVSDEDDDNLSGDDEEMEKHDNGAPSIPPSRSRTPSPGGTGGSGGVRSAPRRIIRKVSPPFQNNTRSGSNRPARQPRREPSVAGDELTAAAAEKEAAEPSPTTTKTPITRKRTSSFSGGRSDIYVPPAPPPTTPNNHFRGHNNNLHNSSSHELPNNPRQSYTNNDNHDNLNNNLARLHPTNLSKLGASTAPPRREIFASGGSKLQISCLTIDSALITNESEKNLLASGSATAVKYGEVSNMAVTDKFGDKGIYTGTLREEETDIANNNSQHGGSAAESNPKKRVVGIPHGTGTMKYEGGRFYKGQWRDGHWHGRGLLRNANGDSYEGDFVYDARHGHGIYKYENGDVYEGDFTEDKRHGKGTFMFHNGSVYRGDFVNGDFEGYGWYEFDDGYYEGEWKGGAYHGIGTLQYTDGGSYTGRFCEGKAHGHGEEKDADGTIRRGVWNKGELSSGSQ